MGSQIGTNKIPVDFDIKSEGDGASSSSEDNEEQDYLETKEPLSYQLTENTPQKMKQQTFDFTSSNKALNTSGAKKGVTEILETDNSFDLNNRDTLSRDDQIRPTTFNLYEDGNQFDVQVEEMSLRAI